MSTAAVGGSLPKIHTRLVWRHAGVISKHAPLSPAVSLTMYSIIHCTTLFVHVSHAALSRLCVEVSSKNTSVSHCKQQEQRHTAGPHMSSCWATVHCSCSLLQSLLYHSRLLFRSSSAIHFLLHRTDSVADGRLCIDSVCTVAACCH